MEIISTPALGQTPRETDDLICNNVGPQRHRLSGPPATQPLNGSLACRVEPVKVQDVLPDKNTNLKVFCCFFFLSTLNEDLASPSKSNTSLLHSTVPGVTVPTIGACIGR